VGGHSGVPFSFILFLPPDASAILGWVGSGSYLHHLFYKGGGWAGVRWVEGEVLPATCSACIHFWVGAWVEHRLLRYLPLHHSVLVYLEWEITCLEMGGVLGTAYTCLPVCWRCMWAISAAWNMMRPPRSDAWVPCHFIHHRACLICRWGLRCIPTTVHSTTVCLPVLPTTCHFCHHHYSDFTCSCIPATGHLPPFLSCHLCLLPALPGNFCHSAFW